VQYGQILGRGDELIKPYVCANCLLTATSCCTSHWIAREEKLRQKDWGCRVEVLKLNIKGSLLVKTDIRRQR
jgi:hypothetical protein